jgi:hypothetical protein
MILRFIIFPAKRENGGPNKVSFCEIAPGEDTFIRENLEEGVNFWPMLSRPYFCPNFLLGELLGGCLYVISFYDGEGAPRGVPPSQDVVSLKNLNFPREG